MGTDNRFCYRCLWFLYPVSTPGGDKGGGAEREALALTVVELTDSVFATLPGPEEREGVVT